MTLWSLGGLGKHLLMSPQPSLLVCGIPGGTTGVRPLGPRASTTRWEVPVMVLIKAFIENKNLDTSELHQIATTALMLNRNAIWIILGL